MSRAFELDKNDKIIGHFGFAYKNDVISDINSIAHDGDTINVRAIGNLTVRLLGIDTPELSFRLPNNGNTFIPINDPRWIEFFKDPFLNADDLKYELGEELVHNILQRINEHTAENHYNYSVKARDMLRAEIEADVQRLQKNNETFRFFSRFAEEVFDRYGRLLAYLNCDQPQIENRLLFYNERLLKAGFAAPYFIWPNINVFASTAAEAPSPEDMQKMFYEQNVLSKARKWILANRANGVGIFSINNPLNLQAFELRYLAEKRAPDRWIIDLANINGIISKPTNYFKINIEDRLYINPNFINKFVANGWKLED